VSLIDETIERLEKRLRDLRPAVEEAREIERLLAQARAPVGDRPTSRRAYCPLRERQRQLKEIVAAEPGIRIKDVAAQMGVTGPRVTQIVNGLEAEGVVMRSPDGLVLKAKRIAQG
jgi:DNA-binding MarR family transcriptional regulator